MVPIYIISLTKQSFVEIKIVIFIFELEHNLMDKIDIILLRLMIRSLTLPVVELNKSYKSITHMTLMVTFCRFCLKINWEEPNIIFENKMIIKSGVFAITILVVIETHAWIAKINVGLSVDFTHLFSTSCLSHLL